MKDDLKPKKRKSAPKTKSESENPIIDPPPVGLIVEPIGEQSGSGAKTPAKTKARKKTVAPAKTEAPVEVEARDEIETPAEIEAQTDIEARIDTYESEGGPEPEDREVAAVHGDPGDADAVAAAEAEGMEADADSAEEADRESEATPMPPAKLERLQKILAQAGISSRRKAEELIEQGRVQVNGQVVDTLGAKADAGRDHIRVDGKLLHGPERHRYFLLNKPKGFVTTVSDPEGRPTVMQFFTKMPERLYPVGRLDYLSEGLLLVTNDGELANQLTRAASGVEKTYLVKVAGQPTEEELERLRAGGVSIERGRPGEGHVRTSPSMIRQVRQGDNPWFEVVLIEGRNRELRKMFEEVGHYVEKIRRVGYGPLVLDVEPGNLRELEAAEVTALRDVAAGKKRSSKANDIRRRKAIEAELPSVAPRPTQVRRERPASFNDRPYGGNRTAGRDSNRALGRPAAGGGRSADFGSNKSFRPGQGAGRPSRGPRNEEFRPREDRPARPFQREEGASSFKPRTPRPGWKPNDRAARYGADSRGDRGPAGFRSHPGAPGQGRSGERRADGEGFGGARTGRPSEGRAGGERRSEYRPGTGRSFGPGENSRPDTGRPFTGGHSSRPNTGRPFTGGSSSRPSTGRPYSGGSGSRPGSGRPFTGGSGSRPSAGPGAGRSFGSGTGSRPARPFTRRSDEVSESRPASPRSYGGSASRGPARPSSGGSAERNTGRGWKPKTGGSGRPASGTRGGARPEARSGARTGGRSGARAAFRPGVPKSKGKPGGKRPGGRRSN